MRHLVYRRGRPKSIELADESCRQSCTFELPPYTTPKPLVSQADSKLFAYSPSSRSSSALHPHTSRLLSRRLFALHQAISSDIFGLIVGNVGLASSKELLQQLRHELKKAKKKSYTLSVGRLNPAKLANFETIECFVLVGCAEGGVVDSKVSTETLEDSSHLIGRTSTDPSSRLGSFSLR
jgi:diphthamide biosynthesis enzyme Dph1/Dph2-like protein